MSSLNPGAQLNSAVKFSATLGGNMAWKSLNQRLDSMPLILAGPVLRQVTDSTVTVWLALKQSATVTLNVYASDQGSSGGPLLTGSLLATAIGTNLYIVAVTAHRTVFAPLTENQIYFYDLSFAIAGPPAGQLTFSEALIAKDQSIPNPSLTYGSYLLPSFTLPPKDLNRLKLIHGSCRKPHAEGHDALAILDGLIDQFRSAPLDRPHQLLLTGDQIYADDVADVLLLMLTDAGETLLGWSETLVVKAGASPAKLADWPSYYRIPVLKQAQFTSDDLKSHLISLGEFLSMYLFAWSDVLWPKDLPVYGDVSDHVKSFALPQFVAEFVLDSQKDTIEEELKYIAVFKSTLPRVRRALANIPTYMICDDHEVTDDWNMTRRFCNQVYGTPVGMRVVQNALVAFSICQAWGNDPDRFTPSPVTAGSVLLAALTKVSQAGFSGGKGAEATTYEQSSGDFQKVVGIHAAGVVMSAGRVFHDNEDNLAPNTENPVSLRYNFRIEGPGHLILVTDTRTWRAFLLPYMDTHADFLESYFTKSELARQINLTTPLNDRLLLVVLTTNAPPIASVRYAVRNQLLVDVGNHPGEYAEKFVKNVINPLWGDLFDSKKLSGPVRAIYENDLYDSWEFPSQQFNSLIVQVDSLLQKQGRTQQVIFLSGDVHSSFASRLSLFAAAGDGILDSPRMVVGQLVASALKNQSKKTRGQQLEGYTYAPMEIARHLVPKFVPEAFKGPTLTGVVSDSVYRLDYLVAQPGQTSGQSIPDPLDITEGADVANLRNYSTMSSFVMLQRYRGASPLQIIGHNSLAELRLVWSADRRARHILHWQGSDGTLYSTTYDVSLNLKDSQEGGPYEVMEVPGPDDGTQ